MDDVKPPFRAEPRWALRAEPRMPNKVGPPFGGGAFRAQEDAEKATNNVILRRQQAPKNLHLLENTSCRSFAPKAGQNRVGRPFSAACQARRYGISAAGTMHAELEVMLRKEGITSLNFGWVRCCVQHPGLSNQGLHFFLLIPTTNRCLQTPDFKSRHRMSQCGSKRMASDSKPSIPTPRFKPLSSPTRGF